MAKVEEALEIIKGMTLLELRDLNKAIEEEFGITAAAPMMMAAGPAGGAAAPAAARLSLDWASRKRRTSSRPLPRR